MKAIAFHIAVFCKAPVANRVKTRLIPMFGAEGAKDIYVQLAERTLSTVHKTCEAHEASASLWVTDDVTHAAVKRWSTEFNLPIHRQVGADLGARMLHCLQTMGATHQRILLIGTDCPAFTPEHLLRAANALTQSCGWVFTPAEDGGYVLVGTTAPRAEPFTGIAWSTGEVMSQTRAALSVANLIWAEMNTLWDVDIEADVRRAVRDSLLLQSFKNIG
jgi:rSAM/selenodomain-associated transferase 1